MTTPVTGTTFFSAFLKGLGITPNAQNLAALEDVRHYEGNNTRNNPLNAIQVEPGSTSFNSVGVQAYPDAQTGLAGSVALFSGSHWDAVRQALSTGSESSILGAFDAAYTWSPGTHIPTLTPQSQALEAATAVGSGGTPAGGLQTVQTISDPFPGGAANPGNWPSEIGGAAVDPIISGIESIISTITGPIVKFVENSFLVIAGAVLLIVGLLILGHVATNSADNAAPVPSPSSKGGTAAAGGSAEDAAVLA